MVIILMLEVLDLLTQGLKKLVMFKSTQAEFG